MSIDTTELSYWLNWRFFICLGYVLIVIAGALYVIWKFEGPGCSSPFKPSHKKVDNQLRSGYLHSDDAWKTSLTEIHPAYLLVYRLCSFIGLLSILTADIQSKDVGALYFYTQWTFTLVTLYFGVGSVFSMYGCHKFNTILVRDTGRNVLPNAERNVYVAVPHDLEPSNTENGDNTLEPSCNKASAGLLGYSFQVIFQVAAGSSMLSDLVFWFLIYPFILPASFLFSPTTANLVFSMHSFNVILLIVDAFLNNLRFPFFRIAYFALWTTIYVIFQWILHACFSMWWPYPFLDLSSPYAPAWYLAVGLIMLPSFGLFALIVRLKHFLLSKFPESA